MIYKNYIENGTVDHSLPNYATKFALLTSDILDTLPGDINVNTTYYDYHRSTATRVYPPGPVATEGLTLDLDATDHSSFMPGDTVWKDLSGNNNSGTLIGATLPSYADHPRSLQFTGSGFVSDFPEQIF